MSAAGRLDAVLVRRGLARSRRSAADLVAAGRVTVAGAPARKASQPVDDGSVVSVTEPDRYVSRAAHKLAGALRALGTAGLDAPTVDGARCLDAGASTGGFTQVLLEQGALHVTAADVGHGQIAAVLRDDPRVTVLEGCNIRDLHADDVGGPVDTVVADLSFISLTMVAGPLVGAVRPGGGLLLLVKPQFEVGRRRLGASGVVTSPALRRDAVVTVATAVEAAGARVEAVVPSDLPGPAGNHEYFLSCRRPAADEAPPGTSADAHDVRARALVRAASAAVDRAEPARVSGADA